MERTQVVDQAYRSVKWAVLANILPRLITPVSTIVLAGLLSPTDFGIVAASTLVVMLAQIVVGMGMGTAVVQRQKNVPEAASVAFGLSLLLAFLLYGVLWWLSPLAARMYDISALNNVIRVAGLSLMISAFISIPTALLQRSLDFKRLFWIGSVPQIMTAIVSVIAAVLGGGYWALVIGQLTGLSINAVLVWRASEWRPQWIMRRDLVGSLLGFGLWVMVSSFQGWLFLYGDNAIAGYFLGVQGLGVYALGFNIANLLPGMIVAPIAAVAYPTFCGLHQNGERDIGLGLLKVQTTTVVALAPICFGLSALAVPTVNLLYGNKWPGLGMVIQWLAIMPGLSNLWSLNADAYRAANRPDVWTKVAGVSLLIYLPLLIIAGRTGLLAFTLARFVGAFAIPVLNVVVASRILKIGAGAQLKALTVPMALTMVMYALVWLLRDWWSPFAGINGWLRIMAIIVIGIMVYGGLLRLTQRELCRQLVASMRRVVLVV